MKTEEDNGGGRPPPTGRPFLRFVLALVLPSCLALGWGLTEWGQLRDELRREADVSAAEVAIRILATGDEAPDTATSLAFLPVTTGRNIGLYRDGERIRSWGDRSALPDRLDPGTDLVRRPVVGSPGAFLAVVRREAPSGPLSRPVVLVIGLLYLFSLASGWMLLTGQPGERRTRGTATRLVLVGLIPAGIAVATLMHLARDGEERIRAAAVRSLAEAAAVAARLDLLSDDVRAAETTGLRVEGLAEAPADLASLRPPPPGYTSTGTVASGGEPHLYLATRDRGTGSTTVFLTPGPGERVERFRLSLLLALAVMLLWMGVGVAPVLSRPAPDRPSGTGRAGGPPPPP